MKYFKKGLNIFWVSIILFLVIIFYWYIPNINSAKSSITEFDFKYYDVICKNKLPEYDNLVSNSYFSKEILMRDKYYSLLYNKGNKKISQASIGNTCIESFLSPGVL